MERRKSKANAAARGAGRLCGIWLLVGLAVLVGACRDSIGTALYVTTDFPPSLQMDQLVVTGTVAGSAIGPQKLPEDPGRLLTSGETFRVLLPSAPDNSVATLSVEGLRGGLRVALGMSQVEIREGSEVDVTVRLEPNEGCSSCSDGCCTAGQCLPFTFPTCRGEGGVCAACDRKMANACSAEGSCACGQGPACDPFTSDQCSSGQCRCGNNAACGAGQECVAGKCECTPSSCSDGCCISTLNICAPGTSATACGIAGEACMRCKDSCKSDRTCNN